MQITLWVKSDGEVEPLVADKNVLQKLRLKRKYSYNTAGDYYGNAIIGVELEDERSVEGTLRPDQCHPAL